MAGLRSKRIKLAVAGLLVAVVWVIAYVIAAKLDARPGQNGPLSQYLAMSAVTLSVLVTLIARRAIRS